jgi:hypothetical protein
VIDSLEDRRILVDIRFFPRPNLSNHDWIPRVDPDAPMRVGALLLLAPCSTTTPVPYSA